MGETIDFGSLTLNFLQSSGAPDPGKMKDIMLRYGLVPALAA